MIAELNEAEYWVTSQFRDLLVSKKKEKKKKKQQHNSCNKVSPYSWETPWKQLGLKSLLKDNDADLLSLSHPSLYGRMALFSDSKEKE